MAARVVQINSFCGGTSKLADSEFLGMEETVNMYPETVTATDTYTTKMMKSVEGFSGIGNPTDDIPQAKINGFGHASVHPGGKSESVITVWTGEETGLGSQKSEVYSYNFKYDADTIGYFVPTHTEECSMLELQNGTLLILRDSGGVERSKITIADPTSASQLELPNLTLPVAFDHNNRIDPTQMAQLNFRVILNDRDSDFIYWSEINRPTDATDTHAFEQSLTQYAYTKNDGTVVTFADNVFYAPAVGTYDPATLTTQTVDSSALNSMKMDFKADKVVALRASDSSLFVFGRSSLQILRWQNSTIAPFAIVHKSSLAGVCGKDSVTLIGNECFFVGKGPNGMLGAFAVDENGNVRKVSTIAEDQLLARIAKTSSVGMDNPLETIRTFAYSYKGHQLFVFTIKEGIEETRVFDLTENVWTSRACFDNNGDRYAWNVRDSVSVDGEPFFYIEGLDEGTGCAWFDATKHTDMFIHPAEGYHIRKERTTGIKYDGINDIVVTALELIINAGTTNVVDQTNDGYDPRIMLQVSVDGGRTWSDELWANAGRTGEYSWRVRWNQLGRGARFAFRVAMSDPFNFEIATAYLSYMPCGNRV